MFESCVAAVGRHGGIRLTGSGLAGDRRRLIEAITPGWAHGSGSEHEWRPIWQQNLRVGSWRLQFRHESDERRGPMVRRCRIRGTILAVVLAAIPATVGCTAPVSGQANFPAPISADGPQSWVGGTTGIALLLQWVRTGSTVTGTLTGTYNSGADGVKTEVRSITGMIGGNAVVITESATATVASLTLNGQLIGTSVSLEYPSDDGTIKTIVFTAGGIADFTAAASTIGNGPPMRQSAQRTFDHTKVEAGVTTILTSAAPAGYGLKGVIGVTCPDGVAVVAGATFQCTATIGGAQKIITITIKDSTGKYEVSVPN